MTMSAGFILTYFFYPRRHLHLQMTGLVRKTITAAPELAA